MMHWMLLIVAVVIAVYGAKLLVDGSVAISHRLNIPPFIIGAVVIGFGSSMPEFAVNIQAGLQGDTDLALGNILGSNLFNICVTLAIVALIHPLAVGRDTVVKDLPMHFIAALMVGVCGNQLYLDHIQYHELMLSHGIIFLCFFSIYLYYTLLEVFADAPHKTPLQRSHHRSVYQQTELSLPKSILYIVPGLIGLVLGGELIVTEAKFIAVDMGLSDRVVGLLIVGPGTSVPEFIACMLALYRRNTAMVMGNILGSNLFNIFFILGVTAIITPVPLDLSLNIAVLLNIVVALFLSLAVWLSPSRRLGRGVAFILLSVYGGYLYSVL